MFRTGNSFADYFLLGVTFLPLLTAVLIIVRGLHGQQPFNYLALVCVLCFFQGTLAWLSPMPGTDQYIAERVVSLLLFLFLFLLFRSNLGGRLRYGLNLFLTALVSVLCTYWTLQGWGNANPPIEMLLGGVLILLILISLRKIIRNDELGVFRHSLFWIEGGTLFYLLLFVLLEGIGRGGASFAAGPDPEIRLFLDLADLVRYCSYLVAVLWSLN